MVTGRRGGRGSIVWHIYSIQKIQKFRSLTKEPNLKREVVMMYTQNDILLSVWITLYTNHLFICFLMQELCVPYSFLYIQHLLECLICNRLLIKVHLVKSAVRKQKYEIFCDTAYSFKVYTKIPSHPSKCPFELQAWL